MRICFIMYPWEDINPKVDSTLRIIHECVKRGHEVAITQPRNLTIRESVTLSLCNTIYLDGKLSYSPNTFYKTARFKKSMEELSGYDVIFMRDNPPLDPLVLNFLDSIKDDVFIMNNVNGLREANNKIYTAAYYDPNREIIPATYVSKNIDYLLSVIEESDQDKMILKPLDGFGGSGVIVIEKSAMHNIRSLLDFYINPDKNKSNYVIIQDYIEGAEKGDARILMLNGRPIGAIRRVPKTGEHRSNISQGGHAEKYKLTAADKILCDKIGKKLVKDGIYFAGLDVINGKLVEVNVMSPGGLAELNKLYKTKIQEKIVDYLEQVVSIRMDMKSKFRPEVLLTNGKA